MMSVTSHLISRVSGVAKSLQTNIEGLSGDSNEILLRKKYFGENSYPRKNQKSFLVFVWETIQDTTLIILMLCAAISLITGMTSKGVPADGLLIKGHSLSIDESSLTGESEPVLKDSMHPFLLSGCKVIDGHGIMLVTGVGLNTEWGQIMAATSEDTGEETPLQVRLNGTATFIGKVGLIVSVLVFSVLFIRYFTDKYNKHQKASEVASSLSQFFSIAMIVVKAWVAGKFRETINIRCSNVVGKLVEGIAQNCTGMVSLPKGGDPEVTGSPTEKALLTWGLELGMDFKSSRSQSSVYRMEAFNSIRKRAGVAIILPNGELRVHWKGEAEVILDLCSSWLDVDGRVTEMTNENVCNLKEVISEMATNSLRCIAYAYQDLNKTLLAENEVQRASWKIPDTKLTIIAIVGIKAAFQVMVLLTLYYKGIDLLHLDGTKERKDIVRNTTIFNTFVFCQLFNEINARKPEEYNVFAGILENRMFVSVVVLSIIFQGLMVEFLNKFAKTTKLSWKQWLISIGIGFLSLPVGYFLKFINVPRKPIIMTHKIRRKHRSRQDRHAHQQSVNEQHNVEQTTCLPIGFILKFIKFPRKLIIMTAKVRRKCGSGPDGLAHRQYGNEELDIEQTT